jgi:heme exporter protein A
MSAAPVHDLPPTAPQRPALEAEGLRRAFGLRRAVDGVSFTLGAGECLALFGPNGAGKTTLLRMLGGLLRPTAGRALVDGTELRDAAARRAVGSISHQSMLYASLTARENVAFAARLYGVPDADAATDRALALMRVRDRADTAVRLLSRGLQQRVSIARAMVHGPRIVLLDEPYTGLDEMGARALTTALAEVRDAGATLVLVTHHLSEGLALATHAAMMFAGRITRYEPRAAVADAEYAAAYRAAAERGAA